jgi:hypothetical protein
MMIEALFAMTLAASSQAERCAHSDHPPSSDMICVNRIGHCAVVTVDGHETVRLADEATARRVHAVPHGEDVCWQVVEPVSTRLRAQAHGGGLRESFIGAMESLRVSVYPLGDYDPEFDSRLDALNGVELVADGAPGGTWRLEAERPLPAGEYVVVFRVFGVGNWDKQAVLLRLDPAIAPAPAR